MCHVGVTLSFTRPAKYMYRSIAQFGAWALARAQKTGIEIMDDDAVSIISGSESDAEDKGSEKDKTGPSHVGKAGDPLPPFKNHMIRQRVDRHGNIYHLAPAASLPACNVSRDDIGVIKKGPVQKWLKAKKEWDTKFASSKRRVQKQRAKEMAEGYQAFANGEVPPPSALAGRRRNGDQDREEKKSRSWGMSLWSLWGSKHDEQTIVREEKADKEPETTTASATQGTNSRPLHDTETAQGKEMANQKTAAYSRSRSRRRTVVDQRQTEGLVDENTPAAELLAMKNATEVNAPRNEHLSPAFISKNPGANATESFTEQNTGKESNIDNGSHKTPDPADKSADDLSVIPTIIVAGNETDLNKHRPKSNGIAFPFTLKRRPDSSASVATLTSAANVPPSKDVRIAGALESGVPGHSEGEQSAANGKAIEGEGMENGKNLGVEAGEIVSSARPALDSFVTAQEDLPRAA